MVYRDLHRNTPDCPNLKLFEVGNSGLCTHGPDPAPAGVDMTKSVPPVDPAAASGETPAAVCEGDGQSGYRTQVLYVRASDRADRFSQYASSFAVWAQDANNIYNNSAAKTGGSRQIRFVTTATTGGGCTISMANVVVPTTGDDSFSATVSAVKALGYNNPDRKYMMFVDDNLYCGIGHVYNDDRLSSANYNNNGGSYGRNDAGCWNGYTAAHEHNHNLGGVQLSAPNSSQGWHCTDEYDTMCYSDDPYYPDMQYRCTDYANEDLFDCNNDDYFHTNPPANSYLATRWNTANNRFLIGANVIAQAPSAPTNLTVSKSDANKTITIDWSPPASDGGSAITKYWAAIGAVDGTGAVTQMNMSLPATARTVTFTNVVPGTYNPNVVAHNSVGMGTIAYASQVTISGVTATAPTAVTNFTVTKCNECRTVTMNWSPPASDGGSSITGYDLRLLPTNTTGVQQLTTAPSTSRSYTFTNVSPGTYTATAAATNAIGGGPQTTASVGINVPSAPTSFGLAKDYNAKSVNVTWQPPVFNGGSTITNYRVTRSGGGMATLVRDVSADTRSSNFTGLTDRQTFTFKVEALNGQGYGTPIEGSVTMAPK